MWLRDFMETSGVGDKGSGMKAPGALFLSALLLPLSACGDTPEERFAQAQEAFAHEDYRAARAALSAALREAPGDVATLTLLARTQLRMGDPEGAEKSVAQLAGKLPAGEHAQLLAELLLLQGRAADASAALIPGDRSTTAWRLRAAAWLAQGEQDRAADAFAQGMAAGEDVRLAIDYARYLLQAGRVDEARALHRRMRGFAPDAFETIVLDGDLAAAEGRPAQAAAAFRRASERYPRRSEPLLALARQLFAQGKTDEAMTLVERADELAGESPEVIEIYVLLLAAKGDWSKVRSTLLAKEASLDPTSTMGLTYGEALLRLGQPEQARSLFARARLLRPRDPYVSFMLGEAQLATGDPAAAWRTLKPLSGSLLAPEPLLRTAVKAAQGVGAPEAASLRARLEPARMRRHMALVEKAQGAMARQDWSAAIAALSAIPGGSGDPEILSGLAIASSRSGRHADAIRFADQAVARRPGDAGALHMAGLARLEAGETSAARVFLQQAVEADPRDSEFRRDLQRALQPSA
jgi:predicted Zn-dependent protease